MAERERRPGRPRSCEQGVPTAEKILAVAEELFLQRGYDGVSTDTVAERCGLTKAAVYYHFPSKAELFTQAISRALQRVCEQIDAILEQPGPVRDRLFGVACSRLQYPYAYESFYQLIQNALPHLSKEQVSTLQLPQQRLVQAVADALFEALVWREIRDVDPQFAARAFITLVWMETNRLSMHPVPQDEAQAAAQRVMDLFWWGLANVNRPPVDATGFNQDGSDPGRG
ncbi:MAG: TetR/AcrR family transcriptional regulator [Alicyclobacillus sp.]|nr:TetR/AcrR family transcriptional regulator [Alicyclobacillus sp.]